jgi:uncharacterized protein (DUF1499 family)
MFGLVSTGGGRTPQGRQGGSVRRLAARVWAYRRLRPVLVVGGCALVVALAQGAIALVHLPPRAAWLTLNDVETGRTAAYPELQPYATGAPPEHVLAAVAREAADIPRWRVTRVDTASRTVRVEVRTALFGFVDDLTAVVAPTERGSVVIIRSRSRVGRGDLGENARHIAALLARLRTALPLAPRHYRSPTPRR